MSVQQSAARYATRPCAETFGDNMKSIITLLVMTLTAMSFAAETTEFTTLPISDLTPKHIGYECIVSTAIKGLAGIGSGPPKGMITTTNEGIVFRGRLDEITKDSIIISAAAGVPSDSTYRKSATIEKRSIKKIQIGKNTEQRPEPYR